MHRQSHHSEWVRKPLEVLLPSLPVTIPLSPPKSSLMVTPFALLYSFTTNFCLGLNFELFYKWDYLVFLFVCLISVIQLEVHGVSPSSLTQPVLAISTVWLTSCFKVYHSLSWMFLVYCWILWDFYLLLVLEIVILVTSRLHEKSFCYLLQ